jgi:protein-S-isoprenylcysteine O-methyltransferase Ste14
MGARSTTGVTGPDLQALQRGRKQAFVAGIAACAALVAFTDSRWRVDEPLVYGLLVRAGLVLILACIAGRTWCTLYIGGHKKRSLVTRGPYSVVRNPLYVFTIVGAGGIGAQAGSLLLVFGFAAFALAVFSFVVRQEESFLAATFPDEFAAYAARVPRFWPRFSLWQEADELLIRPRLVRRTFLDASLFLLAVPLMELKTLAQQRGWVPVLLHLI